MGCCQTSQSVSEKELELYREIDHSAGSGIIKDTENSKVIDLLTKYPIKTLAVCRFGKLKAANEIDHETGTNCIKYLQQSAERGCPQYMKDIDSPIHFSLYRVSTSSFGAILDKKNWDNFKTTFLQQVQKNIDFGRNMLWSGPGNENQRKRSLLILENFSVTFHENKEAIDYLEEKARGKPREEKEKAAECQCKLKHEKVKRGLGVKQAYSIALAMDIDHLGLYIKKMQSQFGDSQGSNVGLSMAGEKIVEIGNCMFDFCNQVNSNNSSQNSSSNLGNWVGYHTHGDEFIILTGSSKTFDFKETSQLVEYNGKLSLKMIDLIKKRTSLSVTVGIGNTFGWADKAVSTAKQNNHRSIVAICSSNSQSEYQSWIGKNDNEIDEIVDCCWGKRRIALNLKDNIPVPCFLIERV